jgi:Domain of unknown function (DUF5655)/Domain of unknown function (DUF4287)
VEDQGHLVSSLDKEDKLMARAKAKSPYSVHPGIVMVQSWVVSLPQKTGRSLDEWIQLVKKEGPRSEKERRDWLKTNHGLGTNTAWWIAERAAGRSFEDEDPGAYLVAAEGYVAAMFDAKKAGLRPIYDALLKLGLSLGRDVKVCPCKTMVPLYRRHVFAQIKPSTMSRIDLGLALEDTVVPERLIDTGGLAKKDRITHRVAISSLADIDTEVKHWLRFAYDLDA